VLDGKDIALENVEITAGSALVIKATDGAKVTVQNLKIENGGFELVPLTADEQNSAQTPEYLRLRGYRIVNRGAKVCGFNKPGEFGL
jgi:UDP-sugar pyrophosphorylase